MRQKEREGGFDQSSLGKWASFRGFADYMQGNFGDIL
jgi:hypothetical protein